ncbi:MAG: hypothetical protein ACJ8AO_22700 [Gemmatimonadaceae bacterium]
MPKFLPPVSDRMLRGFAVFFALNMLFVVASGWIPGWYTWENGERMLFGLFMMSPLDDITHGLTALAFAYAAVTGSPKHMRFVSNAFGWYYALDAIFFLLYGAVNDKPWIADIALNAPHVGISAILLYLVYAPRAEAVAPARALQPAA